MNRDLSKNNTKNIKQEKAEKRKILLYLKYVFSVILGVHYSFRIYSVKFVTIFCDNCRDKMRFP
jgi:hypothetical protein